MAYSKRGKTRKDEPRRKPETVLTQLIEWADSINVAEEIDGDRLANIGDRVVSEYDIDENSRADWKRSAEKALERAEMKTSTKSYPFDGAANVKYPMLTVAALQFSSRAYMAIVDGQRIVKGQVIGADKDGAKRSKADRVSKHMSYQLSTEMPEWEEDTDTLLHQLPIVGCAFRKVFYDPVLKRNRSEMVSALDFVVNQKTRSLDTVPRATHIFTLYPHEIEERICDGVFVDCDLGLAGGSDGDDDEPHVFLEQHRYLDLDEDGHREPWIVTVHKDTSKVVRITANYDPAKLTIDAEHNRIGRIARYNTFVKFPFFRDFKGGFYDLGFGKLLESLNEVIDSTINQMLDAGHLQNAGGGFIGSGLGLKKNQLRFAPGQYHVVQSSGQKISEAIFNMQHPGPSQVLFNMLGMMVESAKEIASVKDILSGELARNQTATTTLAMIEQGMKVYTSIYKRIYRALKKEYALLAALNGKFLPDEVYYVMQDDEKAVARADYDMTNFDMVPVADPNIVTDAQKMARAQLIMELIKAPGMNAHEGLRRVLEAAGIDNTEELLTDPAQQPPPPEAIAQQEAMAADVEKKKADAVAAGAKAQKDSAEAAVAQDDAERILQERQTTDFQEELYRSMRSAGFEPPEPEVQLAIVANNGNGGGKGRKSGVRANG